MPCCPKVSLLGVRRSRKHASQGKGSKTVSGGGRPGPLQHRVRPRVPPGLTVPKVTCKREHGTRTCGSGAGCRPGGGGGTGPRRPRDPRSSGGVAFQPARSPQSPAAGNGGQKTGETPQASGRHVCECSAELGRDPGLRRPGWGRGFAGVQGDRPPAVMEGEPAGVAPPPPPPCAPGPGFGSLRRPAGRVPPGAVPILLAATSRRHAGPPLPRPSPLGSRDGLSGCSPPRAHLL